MTRNRPVEKVSAEDAAFVRGLVIFEDDKVIVFDKPSGLAVQGGGGVERSLDGRVSFYSISRRGPHALMPCPRVQVTLLAELEERAIGGLRMASKLCRHDEGEQVRVCCACNAYAYALRPRCMLLDLTSFSCRA